MHNNNKPFIVYAGTFLCQRCGEEVTKMRFWKDTQDLTWQCSQKHISKVSLYIKKKRKNERTQRV